MRVLRTLIGHNQFFDPASCLYRAPVYPEITSSLGERAILHCHTSQTLHAVGSKASVSKGTKFTVALCLSFPSAKEPLCSMLMAALGFGNTSIRTARRKKALWLHEK